MRKKIIPALIIFSFFGLNYLTAQAFVDTKTGEVRSLNNYVLSPEVISRETPGPSRCTPCTGIVGTYSGSEGNYVSPSEEFGCRDISMAAGASGLWECECRSTCTVQTKTTFKKCNLLCDHRNVYDYSFDYSSFRDQDWIPVSQEELNKCEEIKLKFTPQAEWFASFDRQCAQSTETEETTEEAISHYLVNTDSPPTSLAACTDGDECLSGTTEYSLTPETWGKGVQKIASDFVERTEKSLSSPDSNMQCQNGICTPLSSGAFTLNASAPSSSYFGQCRGYGATINTPETAVSAVSSSASVNVANRPPVATVSIAKDPIAIGEEVNVTCDIVDPDDCVDKIAKVKWSCVDSAGKSQNCYLSGGSTGAWSQGSAEQILTSLEKSNPYRATAKFKATQTGAYAITCEAWDDDAANPLSGTGIGGVQVAGNCGEDAFCNPNCNPPDPDCAHCGADGICIQNCNPADPDCTSGVIPAQTDFCYLMSAEESENINTICDSKGEASYGAYAPGIEVQKYQWDCLGNGNVQETTEPEIACVYDKPGSYHPALNIVRKNGSIKECDSGAETLVTDESKCEIGARINGTSNNYENNLNVESGAQVEAKVSRQCLDGGTVSWLVPGGTIMSRNKDTAIIKFSSGGSQEIKAGINKDGKTTDCGKVELKVKEEVKFGL